MTGDRSHHVRLLRLNPHKNALGYLTVVERAEIGAAHLPRETQPDLDVLQRMLALRHDGDAALAGLRAERHTPVFKTQ